MKNILITGISGGIGKCTAEKLLASDEILIIGLHKIINDEIKNLAERYHGKLLQHE